MDKDSPVEVGDTVADVTATLVRPDGTDEDVSLGTLVADRPVLLSFYTVDFSPDCIDEWCSFRDFDWFSSGEHVKVVGCSKSSPGLHHRFIDHLGLKFPLYSDADLRVSNAFGVTYRALGDHWLDPTRDTPPVDETHDAITERLDVGEPQTFGF